MKMLIKTAVLALMMLVTSTVFAADRPTLQFDGISFYLAKSYYEVDGTRSPVNVIELYYPEGETSDNYSRYIKRVTLFQVTSFKDTANSMLHEFLQDNKNIPHTLTTSDDGKKVILNIAFWWPFRPNVVYKSIFIFQEDTAANRAMYYQISQDDFYGVDKSSNEDLIKQGKSLLLDKKLEKQGSELSF